MRKSSLIQFILLVALLLFRHLSFAQSGWTSQWMPNPLRAVCFTDSNTGTIVGYPGVILRTSNGGATWVTQSSGTGNYLTGVSFTDANVGTIVGENGTILRTTNGGASWVSQSLRPPICFQDVFFTDANTGTLVGESGTILRTSDGGTTWIRQRSGTQNYLTCVFFTDVNHGTIVGQDGIILHTSDGGAVWVNQSNSSTAWLTGVYFSDTSIGTVVGDNGTILRTTDGGLTWNNSSSNTAWRLNAVSFDDANTGTAVGEMGAILQTIDGGATWVRQSSGTMDWLGDVAFIGPNTEIVVGVGGFGIILRTSNGGWTATTAPALVSPLNGALSINSPATLIWHSTANAATYRVQLSTDSLFGTILVDDSALTQPYRAIDTLVPITKYYWHVRAKNPIGISGWSDVWNFTAAHTPSAPILISPLNGSADINWSKTLLWNSSPNAATYRVQLSTDSFFGTIFVDDSALTDPYRVVGPLVSNTTYYWRVKSKNWAGTSEWSVVWDYATAHAPSAPTTMWPPNGSADITMPTTLFWNSLADTATYRVQLSTDSLFGIILVDDSALTNPYRAIDSLAFGVKYYWRVKVKNWAGASEWSVVWNFTTAAFVYSVADKWNMISIPVTVSDRRKTALFSDAASNAFAYGNGYEMCDTLENGIGYWLKFSNSGNVGVNGTAITIDTINVRQGWNMIGSISHPVPTHTIGSIPGDLIVSDFFGYENGYRSVDTVEPGKGYWVKVSENGKLILASPPSMVNASNRIRIVPTEEPPPAVPDGKEAASPIPTTYALEQNYPNPFNPSTDFEFRIANFGFVSLKVYDVLGREVAALVNEVKQPGVYTVTWDAGQASRGPSSEVYFYRLQAGTYSAVKKALLMR